MSFAFLPLYTGDYLRDTQHLSCSEHGIFVKLLMHCWDQRGPVPLDERKQCGIVNARSSDEVEALRRVLSEFFTRMDDGWYNRRMMREVEKAEALSDKKSTAGKIGAAVTNSRKRKEIPAGARHVIGSSSADARHEPHTPTPTLTPTSTPTTKQNTSSERDANRPPACPVKQIVAGYNQACPGCIESRVPTASRAAHISARWRQIFDDGAVHTSQDALRFFSEFFGRVQASRFLTGRAGSTPGRKPFRADLAWLMLPENFAKVIEGKYDDELQRQA